MHLQTLLASLWACISALLLVAHAAPVGPNVKLSSTDVEQFHLASEVLENVQYFTDAYQDFIDKTPNTTDLAFQSFYNQTMVSLSNERAEELKMAVGLMTGSLLHGATTVNETIAMLQTYRSLEAFRPNPEQLRMISHLIEQVHKYRESRSDSHVAVVKISRGSREFRGTIIFNGKEFAPFCDSPRCFPHSSCRPCPVDPDEHISITTSNSIPDIVIVNNNFYQSVRTSKKTNSTNGVTQRDLKGKNDTTEVALSKGLPPQCVPRASFGTGLPDCLYGNHNVTSARSCPKGYSEARYGWRLWRLTMNTPVICTLRNSTEAAQPFENNLKAPPLQSRSDYDHIGISPGHPPHHPERCAPASQQDTQKGTPSCPIPLYDLAHPEECPPTYTLTYERNVLICLRHPLKKATNTTIDKDEEPDHPLAVFDIPQFSRKRDEEKKWRHPTCRSGIWVYLDMTKSLVCVPRLHEEKVEAYSYENCNETFWGCWGPRGTEGRVLAV